MGDNSENRENIFRNLMKGWINILNLKKISGLSLQPQASGQDEITNSFFESIGNGIPMLFPDRK